MTKKSFTEQKSCTLRLRTSVLWMFVVFSFWLYRNCREWLKENSPASEQSHQPKARIDWRARDRRLAKQVQKVALQLLQEKPPVRITTTAISRRMRQRALIEQHLDKLPETKKALTRLSESKDTFHIRRIHWAAQEVREAGLDLAEWLIVRVAAIRTPLSAVVQDEIQRVIANSFETERSAQ